MIHKRIYKVHQNLILCNLKSFKQTIIFVF